MRRSKLLISGLSAVLLIQPLGMSAGAKSQNIVPIAAKSQITSPIEAPTGFDHLTDRLLDQAMFDTGDEFTAIERTTHWHSLPCSCRLLGDLRGEKAHESLPSPAMPSPAGAIVLCDSVISLTCP